MNNRLLIVLCTVSSAVILSCATGKGEIPGSRFSDPGIEEVLSFASRASSSHNAQPWKIRMISPDTLKLQADTSRYIPEVERLYEPEKRHVCIIQEQHRKDHPGTD